MHTASPAVVRAGATFKAEKLVERSDEHTYPEAASGQHLLAEGVR
jgi:hypothetical protein